MAHERFRETGKDSFFGDLVYDRVVPQDHFLRKLNQVVDWHPFTKKLLRYYKGGAEYGPPPYAPTLVLKMLLLGYLYDLSERQTEDLVNYHLPAKWFVGLAVDEAAPDHATLTVFKPRPVGGGPQGGAGLCPPLPGRLTAGPGERDSVGAPADRG